MGIRLLKAICPVVFLLGILAMPFMSIDGRAQTFNYKTTEGSSIVRGRDIVVSGLPVTLTTWCNEWPALIADPTHWGDNFKFKSLHSFIKFQVDNYYPIQQLGYTYQLTYELRGYYSIYDTTLHHVIYDTLTITNASYNDAQNAYQDINQAKYSNYYKTVVIITGIYSNDGTTVTPAVLIDTMRINYNIESSILGQRYDKISSTYGSYYGRPNSLEISPYPYTDQNYLAVFFNFTSPDSSQIQYTPLNYELEWTFIDDYSTDVATGTRSPISSSDLSYDFNHNCTRVWLNDNHYHIPLAYPSGYLVYRMRTVRPDSLLFKFPVYSDWSYSTPDHGGLSSLNSNAYYHIGTPFTGDSLNWQYTISFAEGGRYKHVAGFYDGLLKNRESITRFNSTPDKLIVAKSIYDFEGRPAIKILPTPVPSSKFSFVHDVDLNSATTLPYRADDFDTGLHTCPVSAPLSPLATTALANVYYSPYNPDMSGVQKFVPDAEGFPLVQTEFSPAFNDRVVKQGGAGPRLQIADSNIISNYYVSTGQKELDHYFGINIGYHSFYNKTVTRDPNMQLSMSVKDYKGKQVMSALIGRGSKPEDHAIIPGDSPDSIYYRDDILNGAIQTHIDNKRIFDYHFHNDAGGLVRFQYLYNYQPLLVCDDRYLNIGARYNYYVTNPCGDTVVSDDSVICTSGIVSSPVAYAGNELSAVLNEGEYTLHKELTVDAHDIGSLINEVLYDPNSCFLQENYFIKKRVKEMSFPCPAEEDECTRKRKELKQELHPNAKYGQILPHALTMTGTNNSIFTVTHIDTVAITDGFGLVYHYRYQDTCTGYSLPDTMVVDGFTYTNLRTMPAELFWAVYQLSILKDPTDPIAEALLPLHPEYCRMPRCYNDTFGARLAAIPDEHIAEGLNLLYLDSIMAHDPLVAYLLPFGYTRDSLAYYAGGHIRLDSFIYGNIYCGCGDSIMGKECMTDIYSYEIQNKLLVNDFVKKAYFDHMMGMYISNRQHFIDLVINGSTTGCSHCALARMYLSPEPVYGNVVISSGLTPPELLDSAWTGMGHAPWLMTAFASLPGAGTAAMDSFLLVMHDSATALSTAADSMMCFGNINNVITHLANCGEGDTLVLNGIRAVLDSMCTAHAIPYGGYTPEIIRYAILRGGGTLNDFCNPYLVSCDFSGPTFSSGQDCRSDSFYRSFNRFFNGANILDALRNPGNINTYTLDYATSQLENEIYNVIGTDHVEVSAQWSVIDTLYKLFVYEDHTIGVSDTVTISLRGTGGCGNVFSLGDSISMFDVACINTLANTPALGLIKQYSFVADAVYYVHDMSGIHANVCSMLGWNDTVQTMNISNNVIAECVPCTQMKSLYVEFTDSMRALGVHGVAHPLYDNMLRNFMNRKLGKVFGTNQYENFIESCALADSVFIPEYFGYAIVGLSNDNDADSFMAWFNRIDTNYDFNDMYRTRDATGSVTINVDFSFLPYDQLWAYRHFIDTVTIPHSVRFNNVCVGIDSASGVEWGRGSSTLVAPPLGPTGSPIQIASFYAVPGTIIPADNVLFVDPTAGGGGVILPGGGMAMPGSSVHVVSAGSTDIWVGNHYVTRDFYTINYAPGITPPWEISRDVHNFIDYMYANPGAGIVFNNYFRSTINEDFFRAEKTDYLNYAYNNQLLPPYNVLDTLQAFNLIAGIPSYASRQVTYRHPTNPNVVTNLYLGDGGGAISHGGFTAPSPPGRDTLLNILSLVSADNPISSGHIFFDTNVVDVYGDSSLLAIRCGDNKYWYMYFGQGDTLWNVYVSFPGWVPVWSYPQYTLSGIAPLKVRLSDSTSRFFTLELERAGDTMHVIADGMATFVVGRNLKLRDVLLGSPITSSSGTPLLDTFNNCERLLLKAAINHGKDDYTEYIDSARGALYASLLAQLSDSAQEQLYVGYLTQQFGVTLYYYDRAGNLVNTVSPGGVVPLDTTILANVDNARTHGDFSAPVTTAHNKVTYYNYDSRNQLINQVTPDGGYVVHYYDYAGRLLLTQNDKQAAAVTGDSLRFTYNIYDRQNRIIETGEEDVKWADFKPFVINRDADGVFNYLKQLDRRDVIMTIYDTAAVNLATIAGLDAQSNLRKRVAVVKYFDSLYAADDGFVNYTYATHYSYDIEGSVKTLVQEYPVLDSVGQRYKRVDYDYDLISGKVNMLSYNRSFPDQYYQRYSYDDDNRITKVETSSDGYIWRRDAAYTYYQHGPLARTELGDLRVQGLDYAYTIQGWLKAVNGDTASMALDMGRDGDLTVNGKDAAGFSLNYFKDDYKSVSGTAVSSVAPQTRNLYNGNIARQTIAYAVDSQLRAPFPRLTRQYMYDQMNRLRSTNNGHVSATDQSITGTQEYYNDYTYDPDGNLKTLNRYTGIKLPYTTPFLMDSFNYYYTPTSNNELRSLTDNAADIGVQDVKYRTDSTILTYLYDLTGNTIKDLVAGQDSIEWNLYNKVVHTRNVDPTVTMSFKYDGMGNRVSKTVTHDDGTSKEENTEYYVRDASGNILATYHEDRLKKPSTFTDTRIFSLSGHDIYGSSRLGTRGYWPLQVGQKWDYYYGLYDTIRLSERKPWYSLEYQDNINHNDQTPYGNTFALPSVNSHMTGQKQYEVTDHLGDVLATVSDARASRGFAASPTDSFGIAGYAPAIMSQHDYYPFGMQMPDRNYEDVGGHSTTVTQTVLAPQLHPWTIIWGDGLATAIGSGVVGSGSPLVLSAPTVGGGLVYNLHPVSSGLNTRVVIKVSGGASSAWVAQVKQGTNSTLPHYLSTTGDHTITFNFPISGTAQLYITQASNVGPISIAKITLDTFAFVPVTAVSQISSGSKYKYGFNGQMKDDEWAGVGNHNSALFGELDTRTGKRLNLDPKLNPSESPYATFGDNPIFRSDVLLDSPVALMPASAYNYDVNKENANYTKLKDDLKYIFQYGGTGPFQRWSDQANRDRAAEKAANNTQTNDIVEVGELALNVSGLGALKKTFSGGASKSLEKKLGQIERNHIPSMDGLTRNGIKISREEAAAVEMAYAEHRAYVSTGRGAAARAFRNQEAALISQAKYLEAFDLNVDAMRSLYGNKYDNGMNQAREYFIKFVIPKLPK